MYIPPVTSLLYLDNYFTLIAQRRIYGGTVFVGSLSSGTNMPTGDAFGANAEGLRSFFNVPAQGKSPLLHVGTDCTVYRMNCSRVG